MNIFFVSPYIGLPSVEGIRNAVYDIAKNLAKNSKNIRITLIGAYTEVSALAISSETEYTQTLPNQKVAAHYPSMNEIARQVIKALRHNSPDIVHIHSANPAFVTFISTLIKTYSRNVPIIVTLYSTNFDHRSVIRSEGYHGLALGISKLRFFLMNPLIKNSLLILMRKSIVNKLRCFNIRRMYFPHLISVDLPNTSFTKIKSLVHLSKDFKDFDRIIFFAGDLTPCKGLDYLLPVIRYLKDRWLRVLLIIPDKGVYRYSSWRRKLILKTAEKYEVEDYILFLDIIPRELILHLLHRADLTVLPYTRDYYMMDIPMFLLESMSVGGLTLASSVAAIPEILKDGDTGILTKPDSLVELRNKIYDVLSDPDNFEGLRKNAVRLVHRMFNKHKVIKKLSELYINEILENARDLD